jgi:hypothetical protein
LCAEVARDLLGEVLSRKGALSDISERYYEVIPILMKFTLGTEPFFSKAVFFVKIMLLDDYSSSNVSYANIS